MLSGNGLECGLFLVFEAYFTITVRCAIPNRATLPRGEDFTGHGSGGLNDGLTNPALDFSKDAGNVIALSLEERVG